MNIYDITSDYLRIQELMTDPELDPQTLADTFEGIDGEFMDKCDGYARIIKNLEGDILSLKNEEDRLKKRRQAIENNIERMKETLKVAMETTGKTKFKTELFSFGVSNTPAKVVLDIEDITKLPSCYLKTKYEVDKAALKEDLKNEELDLSAYAHLESGKRLNLR